MTKKKKCLIASLATVLASLSVGAIAVGWTLKSAEAESLFDSLLLGNNYKIEEFYMHENGRRGTLFSPLNTGASIQTKKKISGGFSAEVEFLDSTIAGNYSEYRFQFTDANSNNSFDIVLPISNGIVNAHVEHQGNKFGVAYDEQYNEVMQTSKLNESNSYMKVNALDCMKVEFDPNLMQIKINGYILWDFSKSSNDGRDIGYYLDGFAQYNVKFTLTQNTYGSARALIYSFLGCDLSKVDAAEKVAPQIFADVKYHAVVDKSWDIPQPISYDILDGEIDSSSVEVKIIDSNNDILLQQNYSEDLSIVIENSGIYRIIYTVNDSDGNVATQYFNIQAFDKEPIAEYVLERDLDIAYKMGVGTEIELKPCFVAHELFCFDTLQKAKIRIYRDDQIVQEFEEKNSERFSFSESGEYVIEYYLDKARNTLEFDVSICDDLATLSYVQYQEFYVYGDLLNLQEATITLAGNSKAADYAIVTPTGRVLASNKVLLNELGQYTIRYTAILNGKQHTFEKKFIVQHSINSVVMENAGVTVGLTQHPKDSTVKGMLIQSYSKSDTTFVEAIDFSTQMKDDSFLELVAVARNVGSMEYNMFNITLTDVDDANNCVQIRVYAHNYLKQSMISVSLGQGTPLLFNSSTGIGTSADLTNAWLNLTTQQIGTPINHSFANIGNIQDSIIKFYLDYQEMKIYANAGEDASVEIADLDDEQFTRLWGKSFTGFTHDKAYCSINYEFRNKGTLSWDDNAYVILPAEYLVCKIGGYNYSTGSIADNVKPKITLNEPDKLSQAIVGREYKIFDGIAVDGICGVVPLDVYVAYNYGKSTQVLLEIKDNKFIPLIKGNYVILYIAVDNYGNVAEITRTVTAVDSPEEDLDFEFNDIETERLTGKKVYLKQVDIWGGVGNYEKLIKVEHNGQQISVLNDEIGFYFIPEREGTYVVDYLISDYIKNTVERGYSIQVEKNTLPIFDDELVAPLVLTAGQENVLPSITATDFYNYPSRTIQANIYIKYPNSDVYQKIENRFVLNPDLVKTGDIVTFKYEVVGEALDNNVNVLYYELPVAKFNAANGYINLADYFVTQNASITASDDSEDTAVYANLGTGESSLVFGKKILKDGFTFVFKVAEAEVNGATFTLCDSEDSKQRIMVSVQGDSESGYQYSINGNERKYKVEYQNDTLRITYDAQNQTINMARDNAEAVYVSDTAFGAKFDGFKSGFIFMKLDLKTSQEAVLELVQLSTQSLSSDGNDFGKPIFVTEHAYGGTAYVGDVYYVPSAIAGDVYGFVEKITVTVKNAKGEYVKAKDGTLLLQADATKSYEIDLDMIGKYTFYYSCIDNNGLPSVSNNVNLRVEKRFVKEDVSITFSSNIPSTAQKGDVLKLPGTSTQENCTIEMMILDPSYCLVSVSDGKVSLSQKGVYTIVYTVHDDLGNIEVYKFYVSVK